MQSDATPSPGSGLLPGGDPAAFEDPREQLMTPPRRGARFSLSAAGCSWSPGRCFPMGKHGPGGHEQPATPARPRPRRRGLLAEPRTNSQCGNTPGTRRTTRDPRARAHVEPRTARGTRGLCSPMGGHTPGPRRTPHDATRTPPHGGCQSCGRPPCLFFGWPAKPEKALPRPCNPMRPLHPARAFSRAGIPQRLKTRGNNS